MQLSENDKMGTSKQRNEDETPRHSNQSANIATGYAVQLEILKLLKKIEYLLNNINNNNNMNHHNNNWNNHCNNNQNIDGWNFNNRNDNNANDRSRSNNNDSNNNENRMKCRRDDTSNYCGSCGAGNHGSKDCTIQKTEHKSDTTFKNMKGASVEFFKLRLNGRNVKGVIIKILGLN